ncbi:MAG: hypothetical protein BroJett009_13080 [Armatimonadota bacterium]|nr:MAG: hypothetical protein BroJett009_13080 [Armatimonadota bacterium]
MLSFLFLVTAFQDSSQTYQELIKAVQKSDVATVRRILDSGVHPDLTEGGVRTSYRTALYWASLFNRNPEADESIATLLIERGATLYPGNSSIFHKAASSGAIGVLRACLKAGSDPNEVHWDRRPLFLAVGRFGQTRGYRTKEAPVRPLMVKELIGAGADVHLPVKENGSKALHVAAFNAFPECLKILLDAGADLNEQTFDDGYTPLHCALLDDSPECLQTARILLDRGARLDLEDVHNRTVEQMVRQKRYTAAIELIEEYKKKRSPPRGA